MTRLERLRCELVALAESFPTHRTPCDCGPYCPVHLTHEHPLAQPLRAIAWSLLPREERFREPEHAGGPLTSGGVNVEKASAELYALCDRGLVEGDVRAMCIKLAYELSQAVVQARSGETLDDVLRRERLSLSEPCEHCDGVGVEDNHETCCQCGGSGEVAIERACTTCEGTGQHMIDTTDGPVFAHEPCSECRNGRVVTEDAIEVRVEVRVAGQVRYARRTR